MGLHEPSDTTAHVHDAERTIDTAVDWRAVMAAVPEGLVVHGADGRIVGANDAACRILGLTMDQLTGRTSYDARWRALRPDGSDFPGDQHPAMTTLRTGAPVDGVVMGVETADGERRWIRIAARLVEGSTGDTGATGDTGDRRVLVCFVDVTAEHARLQDLADSEELYRVLTEATSDGVAAVAPGGRLRYASPAFARMLGVTAGQNAWTELGRVTHPDDHAAAVEALSDLRRHGAHGRDFEMRVRTTAGDWRWAEVRIWLPDDSDDVITNVRDITDRKSMERELADAEALFRQTFEEAPVGLAMTDVGPEPLVVRANRLYAHALGLEPEQLVGRSARDFTHPDDRAATIAARSRLLSGESSFERMPMRIVRRDGSHVWHTLSRSLLRDQAGAPRYVLAQLEDATETRGLISHLSVLAHTDPLTGLTNRRGLEIELAAVLSDPVGASHAAIFFLDLDGFKDVNDRLGHRAGDDALCTVADRLRGLTRSHDTVARVGGDEFVVLARHVGGGAVAEQLVERFSTTFVRMGEPGMPIRASVGMTRLAPSDTVAAVLERADAAMYATKRQRRGSGEGAPSRP